MSPLEVFGLACGLTVPFVVTAALMSRIVIATVEKVAAAVAAPFLGPSTPLEQPPPPPRPAPVVITPPWEDPWEPHETDDGVALYLEV